MRPRFEFILHSISEAELERGVDPTLALLGSQGWEIRAMSAVPGGVMLALQRPLDEEPPLPDALALSQTLAQPLVAPVE